MRATLKTVTVCLCLAPPLTGPASAGAIEDVDSVLETIRAEHDLPALVGAVAKGGEIIAAGAVGVRALGTGIPVTVEDRIHIGSDGKAIAATIAGMLVEEGRLRWDSTIGEVLGDRVPGMTPELAAATLEQLLSHSSGIPTDTPEMIDIYFNTNAFDHNLSDLRLMALDAWKHNVPMVPDGSPFQYSNFGYMIAGAMMEEVTGTPWEQLIRERLYEPLGLGSAGNGPTATMGRIDAAVGHAVAEDGTVEPRLWGAGADMPQLLGPAGTVHMSILDFARWGAWNAGRGKRGPMLIEPATHDVLFAEHVRTPKRPNPPPGTPAEGGYGFGWSIEKFDWADRELRTHNGSNGMNLAKILIDTDRDIAVVAATNIGGRPADLAVGKAMAELYTMFR